MTCNSKVQYTLFDELDVHARAYTKKSINDSNSSDRVLFHWSCNAYTNVHCFFKHVPLVGPVMYFFFFYLHSSLLSPLIDFLVDTMSCIWQDFSSVRFPINPHTNRVLDYYVFVGFEHTGFVVSRNNETHSHDEPQKWCQFVTLI